MARLVVAREVRFKVSSSMRLKPCLCHHGVRGYVVGALLFSASVCLAQQKTDAPKPDAAKTATIQPQPVKTPPVKPEPPKVEAPRPAIYSLAFSLDGKTLAVGTHKEVLLYDPTTWTATSVFTGVTNSARSLTFHPDGKRLAIGSGVNGFSGDLVLWDPSDPQNVINYPHALDTIESIAFSQDGTSMLTASFDSKARFFPWDAYQYGEKKLEEHNGRVTAVAFSNKPKYIFATGALDKMVKIWDFKTAHVVVNFDQATAGITGLAFLSNGDQLVGSSLDGNLYWWAVGYDDHKKVYSGYNFRAIKAHEDGVTAFSASANKQRMVTGGTDHAVRVWKMDDGGVVREFKEPTTPIYCTALSPDGKIAAAAGREGIVWVWDVEANKLLTTLTPPRPKPTKSLAAKPTTTTVASKPQPTKPQPAK
jgi:WD40 repeat protein